MFIIVSLMLCMINITYQENTILHESTKLNAKTLKNEIKTDSKAKLESKAMTDSAAKVVKSEAAAKVVKSEAATKVVKSEFAVKADTALKTNTETQGIPRGWVMIRGNGNYCVKYSGGRRRITQGSCNRRNNVMWRFLSYGGKYIIQNKSGYVMDLYAYKRNNGAHIYSWNRKNGTNQRWSFSHIGGGKYLIRNQHSSKCLDNTGKARRGVGYHQWSCNGRNRNQQFSFIPKSKPKRTRRVKKSRSRRTRRVKKSRSRRTRRVKKIVKKLRSKGSIPKGWTMIRGNGNYCVKYQGKNRIIQGSCNGRNNVMWKFIRYGNMFSRFISGGGKYIIQNKSGYVMDLFAYKKNNGAHIYSWNRNNGTNQRWSFSHIGGGKYLIKNQHSSKCLDNTGKARIGVGYHQWTCNRRNRNQQFSFKPKSNPKRTRRVKKSRSRRNKSKKSRRNKSKNSRRNKSKNNKMKYNKRKTVKFMNGKYSFNLKSGKDFCSTKCSSNKSSKTTVCFNDGVKKCKSCSFNGNKKDSKGKDSQELCNTVCKSINNDKCDFFAYVDDKKKVINKRLLNRFGRIFVKKFIKKQK